MKDPIVWIDDDYNSALEENLERSYDITRFHTANEALNSLDALRQARFIILDMIVPNGPGDLRFGYYTGLELLAMLRTKHDIKTPIIVLTAVEREDANETLKELGVSQILVKPVLGAELREAIGRMLEETPGDSDTDE